MIEDAELDAMQRRAENKDYSTYNKLKADSLALCAEVRELRAALHDSRMCEPEFPDRPLNDFEGKL